MRGMLKDPPSRSPPCVFCFPPGRVLPAGPGAAPAPVSEAPLRAHLAFLADDLLEGRGTGQRGAELTVRYLETELQALGLRPAHGASYRQPVALRGLRTLTGRSTLSFMGGGACATPAFGTEIVYGSGVAQARADVRRARGLRGLRHPFARGPLGRFQGPRPQGQDAAGAGERARAHRRRAGPVRRPRPQLLRPVDLQVRGGRPPGRRGHPAHPHHGLRQLRLARGAQRLGRGALPAGPGARGHAPPGLGHRGHGPGPGEAGRPGSGCPARQGPEPRLPARPPGPAPQGDSGQRRAHRRAVQRGGRGARLGPGAKDEVVVYSAHWDHLGKGAAPAVDSHPGHEGDGIYNGAVDNASGCAALLAMAQAAIHAPARAQPDVPLRVRGRAGAAGVQGLCRRSPLAPGEDRGGPQPGQPQLRGPHAGHRPALRQPQHPGRSGRAVAKASGLAVAPSAPTPAAATSARTTTASSRPACPPCPWAAAGTTSAPIPPP